jgi:predicted O-methyltransferase YrrM
MSISRIKNSVKEDYIENLFATEDCHLKSIREKLKIDNKEGINVGPIEGKILFLLAQLINAKNIVEIGSLYGYSALWLARGISSDGTLHCVELNSDHVAIAESLLNKTEVGHKISFYQGDALLTLDKISFKGPFDLVFIDANKSGYLDYLNWAEKNVKKGGLIIGDNTFLFGKVFENNSSCGDSISRKQIETMQEFNNKLSDPNKYSSIIFPTAEGLTVAKKLF